MELYGLFRAVKAERHLLYGIHFRIKVDARSLIEMINKPDLMPNAPGNRWLAFIQLFDFEVTHVPAEKHKGPDGLSRRCRAEDDSEDSEASMDAQDSHKYIKPIGKDISQGLLKEYDKNQDIKDAYSQFLVQCSREMNVEDCLQTEYSYEVGKSMLTSRLERRIGECVALETDWVPATKLIALSTKNCSYQGKVLNIENETIGPEAPHEHYKVDNDSPDYWNKIIKYLLTLKLPADAEEAKLVKNRSKSFFIHEKRIWR